jgi:hypothetical protein
LPRPVGTATDFVLPDLVLLADNGGPTQTCATLAGSPAINAGANPDGLTTDQRGFTPRDAGGQIDIGAFEFGATAPVVIQPFAPPPPPPPAPPQPFALPDFVPQVVNKNGVFFLQMVDAAGVVRLKRKFPGKVKVLRREVNGDGILDFVVQFQQNGKAHRLAFSALDLAPLAIK